MRIIGSLALVILSSQLVAAAPPAAPPNGPTPPMIDISVPQQDTRLIVVDFKIIESSEGKDQALANPSVAVPIGQTGEISIGNNIPAGPDDGQTATDKSKEQLFVGTKVFVTPVLRRDGKIQMTFKLRVSQLAGQAGATGAPKLDVREQTSNAVASPGYAVAVTGFKIGNVETRITAVPRIMDASAAMKGIPPSR